MVNPLIDAALQTAQQAARQAGAAILSYYQSQYDVGSKGVDNPVTTADLAANRILQEMLLGAFPEFGWLSEESMDNVERLEREWTWVVDPLDGTKDFIQGIDEFAVSIALVQQEQTVLAVTYNPVREEMVSASLGQGTFCNGEPVQVSSTRHLYKAVVLSSRSETKRGEWVRFQDVLTMKPTGSVAYKLAQVASGNGDLTFSLVPKNEWDICAGTLLITEAGGRVSDPHGNPFRFNQPNPLRPGLVATNAFLYDPLMVLIQERCDEVEGNPS